MKRGRPKNNPIQTLDEKPTIFTHKYKNSDGINEIWEYNLNKNPNGPISVELNYPKNYKFIEVADDENLPPSKRRYINPKNGKEIGYQRAKALNLI